MTATTAALFNSHDVEVPFADRAKNAFAVRTVTFSASETYPAATGYNIDVSAELASVTNAKATYVTPDSTTANIVAEVKSHTSAAALIVGLKNAASSAGLAVGTALTNTSYILVEAWGPSAR